MPRSSLLTVPQASCEGGLAGAEGEEEVPASLESILQQGRPDDIPSISFLQPSLLAPEAGMPRYVENSEVLAGEALQEKGEVPRGLDVLQNDALSVPETACEDGLGWILQQAGAATPTDDDMCVKNAEGR